MSNQNDPVVIVSAARTPMGSFQSDFASLAAHDLGGVAIQAAVERAGVKPELVTEVLFGNCLMAGQGQAPARCLRMTCCWRAHTRCWWQAAWKA
jgi:acetyl-CoA C-acetyltransferase